jgi:plasmid stability protein
MASITIRKLDDGVKAKLRIRAAQHGHSMEEEVREILISAVQVNPEPQENLYDAIRRRLAEAGLKGFDLPESPRGPMREPPSFD